MTDQTIENLKCELSNAEAELDRAVKAIAQKHIGGEMEAWEAAHKQLMNAERNLAEAESRPYAVLCDFPLTWDIGAPLPSVMQSDQATLLFFLSNAVEQETCQVEFHGIASALFGAPNDETFDGHPLNGSGFEPYSAMEVVNSTWITDLEKMNSVHRFHNPASYAKLKHFVFPFHDTTFECVASSFTVEKSELSIVDAMRAAIDILYP